MGEETPKQFLPLLGIPLICYCINAFLRVFAEIRIRLVLPEDQLARYTDLLQHLIRHTGIHPVSGGETRFHSVKNGLAGISPGNIVFVHDGVRPLVSGDLIRRCYRQALDRGNAIPAIPVSESLRMIQDDGNHALDRSRFRIIQTPQTFRSEDLLAAFSQPYSPDFTDEASVLEKSGGVIHLIAGEERNIKITRPHDLKLAALMLADPEK